MKPESLARALLGAQRHMPGAMYKAVSCAPVANAYKSRRHATRVTIIRKTTGWYLTDIVQVQLFPNQGGTRALLLTPEQDAQAIAHTRAHYGVMGACPAP